jgi:hypothetical protein
VKKVIDANYFQDPALEGYLRASERNKVVLPDCACMETYKGDPIKNVCRSIRIISRYPKQVILLKSTREIIMLQNSSKTSRRYLEDLDQTKGFRKFCANVERAAQGHSGFEAEIRRFGEEATRHFNSVSQDAVGPVQAIRAIEQSFQREDLHLLRRRKGISHEGRQKIVNDMFVLAGANKASVVPRLLASSRIMSFPWIGGSLIQTMLKESFSLAKLRIIHLRNSQRSRNTPQHCYRVDPHTRTAILVAHEIPLRFISSVAP